MNNQDLGKLILRLTIGGLMLFHGIDKLINGVGGISSMLDGRGLPGFFAYGVIVGEVVAPLMIIFGWRTRIGALLLAFTMIVAVWLVHPNDFGKLGDHGAWALELQGLFFFGALAILFMGAGKLAFSVKSKWD